MFPFLHLTSQYKEIVTHLSFGNLENSKIILEDIHSMLCNNLTHYTMVDNLFAIIDSILKIDD